ncbi:BT_3928 family protein [Pedobacter sp. SYSU D00535]|uniref:BT_3928 family protein n=1 Tax=Pedobacter sp. SYSU D00535 TaxID=2810308 RepID=UPI001A95EAB7|nr:BT_3928 family protein [Pedobacter sp. SYSU D00535]
MKKALILICRLVVGVLFIFSGLIKANDPLGFGYKLQEYFEVFHISFLNDFATGMSIVICALEIIFGAALLLGIRAVQVSWGLLLTIVFFTFLTFYSAAFDVVKSCGCFGDAIPLTPWQSFAKDIVLLILILVIFFNRQSIHPLFKSPGAQKAALTVISVLAFGFGWYTYSYQPVVDFLPYHVGANIPVSMKIPEGAPLDEYEIVYVLKHKKSGESKTMTDKEYIDSGIWKDENWEVTGEPEKKLIKEGYQPKIKDLRIADSQGTDYTAELMENPYYNLLIVAYRLEDTNINALGDLNALAINAAENYNIRTALLTSDSPANASQFQKANRLVMEIFYADAVPLKSMVRSNPGLLLLKDGVVVGKWPARALPTYKDLEETYFSKDK